MSAKKCLTTLFFLGLELVMVSPDIIFLLSSSGSKSIIFSVNRRIR
jgi:hypothetical protein